MIDLLDRNIERLTKIEYAITVTLFLSMLTLMIIQVVCRYILKLPLGWSEELIRFIFIGCTYLGAAIATKERSHIEINILEVMIMNKYSDDEKRNKSALIVNIIRDVITVSFLAYISLEIWKYLVDIYNMNSVSTALLLPMWIVVAFMFAGIFLSTIHSFALIILNLYGRGVTGFEFDGGENS